LKTGEVMAAFQKFDFSQIPKVPCASSASCASNGPTYASNGPTYAAYATCAGGTGDSRKTSTWKKPTGNQWNTEDWQHFSGNHGAVLEYDHELPRAEAEARAFEWVIAEWLNHNPAMSDPGKCVWCGDSEQGTAVIVPFGGKSHGYAELHHKCWEPWMKERRDQAVEWLRGVGIKPPEGAI
jgi:hypothetical protein